MIIAILIVVAFLIYIGVRKGSNTTETLTNKTKPKKVSCTKIVQDSNRSYCTTKIQEERKTPQKVVEDRKVVSENVPPKVAQKNPLQKKSVEAVVKKPYQVQRVPFLKDVFNLDYSRTYVVDYDLSGSEKLEFPFVKTPEKGTGIKLPVHGRNGLRGFCEQKLCEVIRKYNLDYFLDNLSIFADSCRYEPDLAYIDANRGIFIDIEVDEPYSGCEKRPIHYKQGNGTIDDLRNLRFTERGWVVLRFSEKQVFGQTLSCLKYIYQIVHRIDCTINMPAFLEDVQNLQNDRMWTWNEANEKIQNKERENLLGISEFKKANANDKVPEDYQGAESIENAIRAKRDRKEWAKCCQTKEWEKYIDKFPNGNYAEYAKVQLDEELWCDCENKKQYDRYLRESKLQKFSAEAKRMKEKEVKEKEEKIRKEKERLQAIQQEEKRKRQLEELTRKNKAEEERKRQEAENYARQHVTTAHSPAKAPSSRGYA